MTAKAFAYYEIRPVIETNPSAGDRGQCTAYHSPDEFAEALIRADAKGDFYNSFWTLYGRFWSAEGGVFLADAIGDYSTIEAAFEALDAILAVSVVAEEELISHSWSLTSGCKVSNSLGELITKSRDANRAFYAVQRQYTRDGIPGASTRRLPDAQATDKPLLDGKTAALLARALALFNDHPRFGLRASRVFDSSDNDSYTLASEIEAALRAAGLNPRDLA
ncbi:MAG: hypothetical protein V4527_18885 [Pseudomonadota bacterium]